ncbi:hypothetical protein BT63DRAFT_483839 [Microthyrium microscopicum]|uniref:Uncharacterized protein n=1 Tax=Microthyrium microscopicum TaxID=703497 RepID=A0A6A6TXT2_9PEZI|nr:hypothetical protein BT63DRAFT_483839 [Microthyrium microscopicum]
MDDTPDAMEVDPPSHQKMDKQHGDSAEDCREDPPVVSNTQMDPASASPLNQEELDQRRQEKPVTRTQASDNVIVNVTNANAPTAISNVIQERAYVPYTGYISLSAILNPEVPDAPSTYNSIQPRYGHVIQHAEQRDADGRYAYERADFAPDLPTTASIAPPRQTRQSNHNETLHEAGPLNSDPIDLASRVMTYAALTDPSYNSDSQAATQPGPRALSRQPAANHPGTALSSYALPHSQATHGPYAASGSYYAPRLYVAPGSQIAPGPYVASLLPAAPHSQTAPHPQVPPRQKAAPRSQVPPPAGGQLVTFGAGAITSQFAWSGRHQNLAPAPAPAAALVRPAARTGRHRAPPSQSAPARQTLASAAPAIPEPARRGPLALAPSVTAGPLPQMQATYGTHLTPPNRPPQYNFPMPSVQAMQFMCGTPIVAVNAAQQQHVGGPVATHASSSRTTAQAAPQPVARTRAIPNDETTIPDASKLAIDQLPVFDLGDDKLQTLKCPLCGANAGIHSTSGNHLIFFKGPKGMQAHMLACHDKEPSDDNGVKWPKTHPGRREWGWIRGICGAGTISKGDKGSIVPVAASVGISSTQEGKRKAGKDGVAADKLKKKMEKEMEEARQKAMIPHIQYSASRAPVAPTQAPTLQFMNTYGPPSGLNTMNAQAQMTALQTLNAQNRSSGFQANKVRLQPSVAQAINSRYQPPVSQHNNRHVQQAGFQATNAQNQPLVTQTMRMPCQTPLTQAIMAARALPPISQLLNAHVQHHDYQGFIAQVHPPIAQPVNASGPLSTLRNGNASSQLSTFTAINASSTAQQATVEEKQDHNDEDGDDDMEDAATAAQVSDAVAEDGDEDEAMVDEAFQEKGAVEKEEEEEEEI